MPCPPFSPCNKVLKPKFLSIISQTNNGCSLLSFTLAERLLLDLSCENILALSIVPALTACPFSTNKFAKKTVFLCENRRNSLATEIASNVIKMFQIQRFDSKNAYGPAGPPRGGQKGSLSGGPGTQGGPGFRIIRFRMQNSSAQTTACGRVNVFFYFGPKFEHLRTL